MTQMSLFPDLSMEADAGDLVFCWYFRHWKTGRIIRAKDKPFCFHAPVRKR